ncbi:Hypothetical_protein [Hexamita inflata]|uniref:Hypothetical_protein n=1 Tax=Hexamita inflata TaxID=28002 RepID=A0AA86PH77_9EUKA|nr:Hypothetical protein HINF_LOCUS25931 [Hexamita inflata]
MRKFNYDKIYFINDFFYLNQYLEISLEDRKNPVSTLVSSTDFINKRKNSVLIFLSISQIAALLQLSKVAIWISPAIKLLQTRRLIFSTSCLQDNGKNHLYSQTKKKGEKCQCFTIIFRGTLNTQLLQNFTPKFQKKSENITVSRSSTKTKTQITSDFFFGRIRSILVYLTIILNIVEASHKG